MPTTRSPSPQDHREPGDEHHRPALAPGRRCPRRRSASGDSPGVTAGDASSVRATSAPASSTRPGSRGTRTRCASSTRPTRMGRRHAHDLQHRQHDDEHGASWTGRRTSPRPVRPLPQDRDTVRIVGRLCVRHHRAGRASDVRHDEQRGRPADAAEYAAASCNGSGFPSIDTVLTRRPRFRTATVRQHAPTARQQATGRRWIIQQGDDLSRFPLRRCSSRAVDAEWSKLRGHRRRRLRVALHGPQPRATAPSRTGVR